MYDFDKRNEAEYSNYHATYSLLIVDLKKLHSMSHDFKNKNFYYIVLLFFISKFLYIFRLIYIVFIIFVNFIMYY